jgi:glyoxylase-like metal-dependent hydrolase (beta-lactamase superfamily II)
MPIAEVAPDILIVPLPLPFALNSVNAYLIRDGAGWAVVDAGLHTPAGEAAWRAALDELGAAPGAITRVLLTHFHPDHFGMAGWLQALSGAPVLMAPREIALARALWGKPDAVQDPMVPHYARHGAPPEVVAAIEATVAELRACTRPHPALTPLHPGSTLRVGGRLLEAIEAPGHSDGQLIFYDRADRLVLCGDHVLTKITPHIGLWPESEPDPLGRYLASLAALRGLDVRLALPGHKALIADWAGRIDELARHHDERLAAMRAAAGSGATAYEVARCVFPVERFTVHELRFAIAETIAHLELLAARGALRREEGAVVRYMEIRD